VLHPDPGDRLDPTVGEQVGQPDHRVEQCVVGSRETVEHRREFGDLGQHRQPERRFLDVRPAVATVGRRCVVAADVFGRQTGPHDPVRTTPTCTQAAPPMQGGYDTRADR